VEGGVDHYICIDSKYKITIAQGEKNYSIKFRYVCLKCDMDVKDQRNDPPSDPYMPTT
jgi:hypothetical protein